MVAITHFLAALALISSANAAPLAKRIAQVITDSTTQWEQACLTAGGGEKCNPLSVAAFDTLLAGAGACDQQNAADNMIDLAKTLSNNSQLIALTQIFTEQPRNSPDSLSIPYCQQAPRNAELNGLFQCQFQSVNPTVFVGNLQVGAPGTIPFGLTSAVSPPGSCPAHTAGGIADGTQLVDITQDPGVGSSDSGAVSGDDTASSSAVAPPAASTSAAPPPASTASDSSCATAVPAPSASAAPGTTSFALQNGLDAQALNKQFQALTATSTCSTGEDACIDGSFAQCVSGAFVLTPCNTGLTCAVLPLVNSAGTSIACTTSSDALTRIAATGASGGLTGN